MLFGIGTWIGIGIEFGSGVGVGESGGWVSFGAGVSALAAGWSAPANASSARSVK